MCKCVSFNRQPDLGVTLAADHLAIHLPGAAREKPNPTRLDLTKKGKAKARKENARAKQFRSSRVCPSLSLAFSSPSVRPSVRLAEEKKSLSRLFVWRNFEKPRASLGRRADE